MMKKILSCLVMIVALLFSTVAVAGNSPIELTLKTRTVDNTNLIVQLVNLQQQNTVISLSDFAGNNYCRQNIKNHNGYAMNLNLSELPEGRYMLTVSQKGQQVKQIVYKNDKMLMVSSAKAIK